MGTISTDELLLSALQLAYYLSIGMAIAIFYTCVQPGSQVSDSQKKHLSPYLWIGGVTLMIGSAIALLIPLIPQQNSLVLVTSLLTIGLIVLFAPALLLGRHLAASRLSNPIPKTQEKLLAASGKSANPDPVIAISPETTQGNPTAEPPQELEPELIQQNPEALLALIHPDNRESFADSRIVSAQTQSLWKWLGRLVTASRKLKWLQWSSRPQLPANGDILWHGILMDITEDKQAEAVLPENEESFRSTFEQAGVAIAHVGANGQFLRVNPKMCEITGYSREELLQKNISQITYPEDQTTDRMYLQEFFNWQRETLNIEKRYIHKTGSLIWVNVTVSLVHDPTGDPKYFLKVLEDITSHKEAEAAVQRANRDMINIFESITEAFLAVDHQWRFTYINPKAEQILSRKAFELLGKSIWDELPETIGSKIELHFHRAVTEQVSVKFEEFYSPLQIWLQLRAYPYESGLSVYFNDISDRKLAEAELLERSRLSTLAAKVGVALANGGKLRVILQHCTEAMVQQLDVTSAVIWTLNPSSQQLEQKAATGQLIPLNPDLIRLVAQTGQPYLLNEKLETPNFCLLPNHLSGYHLVVEERLIGVITLLSNQPLKEEAHSTLRWVANAIAIAIDRHWARSELLSRRESLLFELANQIRNSLELDTILETAVESIRSLLQIDRCQFLWYRPHKSDPYWEVVKEARNPILKSQVGQYTLAEVGAFADRFFNQPVMQVDAVETLNDPNLKSLLVSLGYSSLLSISIETHAGEIGAISCSHCTSPRPWDYSEVELLQTVVAQLAIALDQAALYTQARQSAAIAQAQAQQLELAINQLQATQAKLVQSEKMSSLGQLVAGIAHEINNPVNFIHGNLTYASAYFYDLLSFLRLYRENYPNPSAEILEQAELINIDFIAKDLPKLLASMQRGTDRIRSIVLSLRNFSRLDEADMKKVDLHEGIENTLLILQHRLNANGRSPEIQVFKEYGNLPPVECYPGQLNQVFLNILSNAIEALKNSDFCSLEYPSPTITIRTSLSESCGSQANHISSTTEQSSDSTPNSQNVVIRIADNGPGMPESVRTRLFDPFFTTKPVGQGTGLGLSISYQIVVEHHHGILTCTSAPGQGTEFWIEIPIQTIS